MNISDIKKIITVSIIFFLNSFSLSYSSPWANVGDIALRNDVEIIARYGLISGPVNKWPMSWKQITANLYKADVMELPSYVRMSLARVREKVPAKINVKAKAYYTSKVDYFSGFEETSRTRAVIESTLELNMEDTSVHVTASYNDAENFNLDGSYLSHEFGNISAYVGAVERWWGPGRETTTLLSTNARPMPSIGLRRVELKPFKSKWLSWMGPWSGDIFISKMDKDRTISSPIFVGMKLGFEPIRNFEIGLSRTLMLCGEGRICNFKSWTNGLIAFGDLDNRGPREQQPGNQLAMLDLSYSFTLKDNMNVKLYAEGTAEDIVVAAPYTYSRLIGASFYGPFGTNGSSYRFTTEYSDTTGSLAWFLGEHRKGVMYNHSLYETGYRYNNKVIGHTLDSNSKYISLKATLHQLNGWQYSLKYQNVTVNTEGDNKNILSISRENINSLTLNVTVPTKLGHLLFDGRIMDNEINTPLENKVNIRVGFMWDVGF
ncbi:MAG: hypothetical protein HOH19_01820 [Kordiimonadaceae bacterium]|nr:hypothetical protein [Kordiimonadaceae bacterium]